MARGHVAELYVHYYLARRGIVFTLPPFTTPALDILVQGPSGKNYKCEIKGVTKGHHVKINRAHFASGSFKDHGYQDGEVDFFILVLLEAEHVFILPASEYKRPGQEVCCSDKGAGWKYKDRTDLFE